MIALLPVATMPHSPLHKTPRKKHFVRRTLATAQEANSFSRCVVASNDMHLLKDVADACETLPLGAVLPPVPFLPRGTLEAITAINPRERLLIVDFRAAFLRPADLIKVAANPCFAASASEPADHPCQVQRFFKAQDAGYLHRLEHDGSGWTEPYPSPLPHRPAGTAEQIDGDTARLKIDTASLSALLHQSGNETPLTHASAGPDGAATACIAGNRLFLPLVPNTHRVELHCPASGEHTLCVKTGNSTFAIEDFDCNRPLVYSVLAPLTQTGEFTFRRNVYTGGANWRCDGSGNLHSGDGTRIHGRQALPSHPLRDGALTVGEPYEFIDQPQADTTLLSEGRGQLVTGEIDCIRAELQMEAES